MQVQESSRDLRRVCGWKPVELPSIDICADEMESGAAGVANEPRDRDAVCGRLVPQDGSEVGISAEGEYLAHDRIIGERRAHTIQAGVTQFSFFPEPETRCAVSALATHRVGSLD